MWEDEEYEEVGKKKSLGDWFVEYFWLIVAVLFFIFFRGRLGLVEYDKAFFFSVFFIIAILFAKATYVSFQNATPKIVYNSGWTTTDGQFETVGNFALIRPAIKAYQWYFKLKGLYVCPVDSIYKIGNNIITSCLMETVGWDELPSEVRSYIVSKNVNPPYNLGYADPEQFFSEVKDAEKVSGMPRPNVAYLIDELKKQSKQIHLRDRIIEGDLRAIESFVSASGRISSRARGGISTILEKIMRKEGE